MARARPFSVLHVAEPTEGGVARCVRDLVADQLNRGWRVAVAAPATGPLGAMIRETGAEHIHWRANGSPGPHSLEEARALHRIAEAFAPAAVHLHSSKAGLVGRLPRRTPWGRVFQPHGWSFAAVTGTTRAGAIVWERFAAKRCETVICVSEAERRRGVGMGVSARYVVVPNAVDLDAFPPADAERRRAARTRLGITDATPLAVCVGRLSREKGQRLVLSAWPDVRSELPNAVVALVGDGPDRAELERIAPLGVRFEGESSQVTEWLAAADVVLAPSRTEGMSLAVLEAMASARPVVAADVDGMREALGELLEERAGALVDRDDAAGFATAVVDRLRDPALRTTEGSRGRARAETRHDLTVWCDRIAVVTMRAAADG